MKVVSVCDRRQGARSLGRFLTAEGMEGGGRGGTKKKKD